MNKKFKFTVPAVYNPTWGYKIVWLVDQFGPIGEQWDYSSEMFHFTSDLDKTLYLLVWPE